jgi:protein TonB
MTQHNDHPKSQYNASGLSTSVSKNYGRLVGSICIATAVTFSIFVVMHKLTEFEGSEVNMLPPVTLASIVFEENEQKVREIERIKPKPPEIEQPPIERIEPPIDVTPSIGISGLPPLDIDKEGIDEIIIGIPDTETRPLVRFPPNYPADASRDGIEGWVELSFSVDEKGEVFDVVVIDAEPKRIFDREARRALRRWKYQPKVVEGSAIIQTGLSVMLEFKLEQ